MRWLTDDKVSERISETNRQLIKSEVGARAIIELEGWFSRQWDDARDFKADLIDLLNRSKFGQEEHTPYQVYIKALYEQFLEDSILRPEWCEYILDKLMERNMTVACAAARAGVDMLHTGDDVATQVSLVFSPPNWRSLMKSRWAKVYAAARAIKPDIEIWYHSDGNVDMIVPELVEIGVTILNPVQPECMDPEKVKRECGDRLVLDGTIGTQSTMPFGSVEEVKKVVRERIRTLGGDGALILSPTHVLEPEVPLENIYAFVEAAKSSKGI